MPDVVEESRTPGYRDQMYGRKPRLAALVRAQARDLKRGSSQSPQWFPSAENYYLPVISYNLPALASDGFERDASEVFEVWEEQERIEKIA